MITVSPEFRAASFAGGVQRDIVVDVLVDGQRVIEALPVECSLKSDGSAKIRTQGTAKLVYSDDLGRSVIPDELTSWLTPYATYLNVSYRIAAGRFEEKVLLGTLKVIGVSDPERSWTRHLGRIITIGSSVSLRLADSFAVTDRERFIAPAAPTSLLSTWQELGAITGLPLSRNVADAPITRSITYQESILEAVFSLGDLLDGVPFINPNGQLEIMPNTWGAVVERLTIGSAGSVNEVVPAELTDLGIYNQVVVRSHDDDQVRILAHRELTSGPLRYGGPFGRVPYFASSQFVTTEGEAADYAESLLPLVSSEPASQFVIRCLPHPWLVVGDVVEFWYNDAYLTGRITQREIAGRGYMTLNVQVRRG